jgi:DNA-directed RNA polymerase specialized sigma24 family protein
MIYESIQPAVTNTDVDLEHLTCSAYLLCLDEDLNNPILSLDSSSRIAFLLHHLLGYAIEDAALLTGLSEKEFRAYLRSAYLQLASREVVLDVHLSEVLAEPALA